MKQEKVMWRKISFIALFAALGTMFSLSAQAQILPDILGSRVDENKVYQDENGTYRYETREKRVWVPEQEKTGVFGTRRIPGHYETVREQVKVYTSRNGQNGSNGGYYDQNGVYHAGNDGYNTQGKQPGWAGKHPHGMPPGQRKKMDRNGNYNNNPYESNNKKNKKKDVDRD
jgi:hypothetical protein